MMAAKLFKRLLSDGPARKFARNFVGQVAPTKKKKTKSKKKKKGKKK